jgi:hypothetical protein
MEWMMFTKEMMDALEADGEKLRQLTGEDHGPLFLAACEECGGEGSTRHRITVYERGCGFPHDDVDERPCKACGGTGAIVMES